MNVHVLFCRVGRDWRSVDGGIGDQAIADDALRTMLHKAMGTASWHTCLLLRGANV